MLKQFRKSLTGKPVAFCKRLRKFRKNIKVVCTDMWKAYLHVLKEKVPDAINVVDKFHIMQKMGKPLDSVRAQGVK